MRGIVAASVYVPRARLSTDEIDEAWGHSTAAGVETKAVPAADEDAVTMAIAAAERLFSDCDVDRSALDRLAIASTTPPVAEGDFASRVVRALGLPRSVGQSVHTNHTAAAAEAIDAALHASGRVLVLAADCPRGDPAESDHPLGAGAAALLIDDDAVIAVRDGTWYADESPGIRFRTDDAIDSLGITTYERNAMSTALSQAVSALNKGDETIDAAAIHQPNGSLPYRLARSLPIDNAAVSAGLVADRIGDAGAATVPIGLLAALAAATDDAQTVAAFFGGGTAAAFACEVADAQRSIDVAGLSDLDTGVSISYTHYLRRRDHLKGREVGGGGANVSLPTWRESLDARYRLIAGKCPECGAVSFPPRGACQSCHARVEFESVPANRTGKIVALATIGQGGAPPEFARYQQRDGAYGAAIVELPAGDGSIRLPGQLTDADLEHASVGDRVTASIRRIYEQEGVPRYGVKFVPDGNGEEIA